MLGGRALSCSFGSGGLGPRRFNKPRSRCCASTAASGAGASAAGNGYLKAGITCGGLSLLGDLLAQTLTARQQNRKLTAGSLDVKRLARMASFGLLLYGPAQHKWYGLLASKFGGNSFKSFASKVALNQLALGPVVMSASFAWNLSLTGQSDRILSKIKNDGPTTLQNGWKFWIPASAVNFKLIPLQYQVLYMSACGLLWTAYLSYASNS